MKSEKVKNSENLKMSDWLPVILVFGGLGLTWVKIDNYGVIMNCGFVSFGVLGLLDSIQQGYYKYFSLKLVKTIGYLVIIILAIYNFLFAISLVYLLLLILLDRIILTPNRLD